MTTLEISLLWGLCLVAGALGGAMVEVWRLRRTSMAAWMAQAAAQKEAYDARQELAEAYKRLGALQATRGEVLEAAIGAAKLAQLDALRPPDSSQTT